MEKVSSYMNEVKLRKLPRMKPGHAGHIWGEMKALTFPKGYIMEGCLFTQSHVDHSDSPGRLELTDKGECHCQWPQELCVLLN